MMTLDSGLLFWATLYNIAHFAYKVYMFHLEKLNNGR